MTAKAPHDLPTIRRFVTGHTAGGKATAQIVDEPKGQVYPERGRVFTVPYTTQGFPVQMQDDADIHKHENLASQGHLSLVNREGTTLRFVDFAPASDRIPVAMHRTQSLDYGLVIEGSIIMVLDDSEEHLLRRGDVAVQRATMHGWKNPSTTQWCRMAFVLIASEKFDVNGQTMGEDLGKHMTFLPSSGQT